MTNEIMNVNEQTGEILTQEVLVNETEDYRIVKLPNGKFRKDMKYKNFHSRIAETQDEQAELYKVFNENNPELVTQLKNMINREITIAHFFTTSYEAFDEETGNVNSGVVTTIQDISGDYYVTSSKSVYYTIFNIMETFGYPNSKDYEPVKVKVTGTQQKRGVQIDLQLVGRA